MGSAGSPGQPPPGCARGVGEGWGASQASLGLAPCLSSQLVVSWGEGCSQAAQVPVTCAHAHSHSHTLTLTYAGSHMQAHTCTNFAAPQLPGSSSQMAPEPRRDVTDTQGAPMGPRSASLPLALPSLPVPGVGGLRWPQRQTIIQVPRSTHVLMTGWGAGLLPRPGEGSAPRGGGRHRWAADKESQKRRGVSGRRWQGGPSRGFQARGRGARALEEASVRWRHDPPSLAGWERWASTWKPTRQVSVPCMRPSPLEMSTSMCCYWLSFSIA